MKVLNVLLGGGGPDVAFRAYLLTAVRRLHVDKVRQHPASHDHRRPDPVRPGRAVHRHRRGRVRGRCGRQGLRLPPRALADGAVAPRGREPEAGRHRSAAGDERQLGLGPGLPGTRGPAPGVPHHAQRRPRQRRDCRETNAPARRLRPRRPVPRATPPRSRTTSSDCRRAPPSTSSSARSTPRSPRCWVPPARRRGGGLPGRRQRRRAGARGQGDLCSSAGARTSSSPTPAASAATASVVSVRRDRPSWSASRRHSLAPLSIHTAAEQSLRRPSGPHVQGIEAGLGRDGPDARG